MIKAKIYMPKLGNNDYYVTIVEWLKKDSELCKKGEPICIVETTKHTQEIIAECDGFLKLNFDKNEDVRIGECIAYLLSDPEIENDKDAIIQQKAKNISEYKITNKAMQLIEEYGIDITIFEKNKLIKEKDVLKVVDVKTTENKIANDEILIFGCGGFCKSVIDILKSQGSKIKGIIDYNYPETKNVMGVPVIGGIDSLKRWHEQGYTQIINTVSLNRKQRDRRYHMLKELGFSMPNIIHKNAVVEPSATLGEGNILMSGSYVGSDTVIGNNCILNVNSVVSHDCKLGNSVNISSGAVVAGIVSIGDRTIVGQCSSIYWGLTIGSDVLIENGCHVFEDLNDGSQMRH